MSDDREIENLKTVKVDVEAVIAEARKNGALMPESDPVPPLAPVAPKPAPVAVPAPALVPIIIHGRISG